jgi:hypothetical protein
MDRREIECEGVDWIPVDQCSGLRPALVNRVMNLRILQNAGNFLTN